MLAQLGTYIFEGLQSPGSMNTSDSAKYSRITLVNGKDVLQKTGEELSELTFTLRLSADFCSPRQIIDNLKQSMSEGEVLPLIMGDGTIIGKYVLTDIDTNHERLSPDGALQSAQVTLSLLEFAAGEEIKVTGTALSNSNPIPQTPVPQVESPAASIASDVAEAQQSVNGIKKIMSEAKGSLTTYKKKVKEVRELSDNAQRSYSSAKTKVESTKKIINRAGNLPTSLDEAIGYAENLSKMDNVTDFSMVEKNINQLSNSADKVGVNVTPVLAFAATKEGGE